MPAPGYEYFACTSEGAVVVVVVLSFIIIILPNEFFDSRCLAAAAAAAVGRDWVGRCVRRLYAVWMECNSIYNSYYEQRKNTHKRVPTLNHAVFNIIAW